MIPEGPRGVNSSMETRRLRARWVVPVATPRDWPTKGKRCNSSRLLAQGENRKVPAVRLSQRSIEAMVHVGLLAVVSGFVLLLLQLTTPHIRSVRYGYDGRPTLDATLPLQIDSTGTDLRVTMTMDAGTIHSSSFRVWPDDCLTQLTVNGTVVPVPENACLRDQGYVLDLGDALKAGENSLVFTIHDNGGKGGVDLRVSGTDPMRVLILCLVTLSVAWVGTRLSILSARGTGKFRGGPLWLVPILVLALSLRYSLVTHPGFGFDVGVNQGWARSAALYGFGPSYSRQVDGNMLPNYPPLSILVFGSMGYLYKATVLPTLDQNLPVFRVIIKTPAILMDVALAAFFWWFIRKMTKSKKAANIAALGIAVHPILIHNSAVWGQTDALYAGVMVFALFAALRQRWILAGFCTAAALMLKMQALVLLPTIGLLTVAYWRKAWWRVPLGALIATTLVLTVYIPGGGIERIWEVYAHSVGNYTNLSLEADNLWMALYAGNAGRSDTQFFFNLLAFRTVGLLLFLTAVLWLLALFGRSTIRAIQKPQRYGFYPFLLTGLIASAFFLLNTEMHERYLVAAFPLLFPMLFLGRRAGKLYLLTVLAYLLNLLHVVQFGWFDKMIVDEFSGGIRPSVAVLQLVLFFCNIREILRVQRLLDNEQDHWAKIALLRNWERIKGWVIED